MLDSYLKFLRELAWNYRHIERHNLQSPKATYTVLLRPDEFEDNNM